jgi:hypothetical protein
MRQLFVVIRALDAAARISRTRMMPWTELAARVESILIGGHP